MKLSKMKVSKEVIISCVENIFIDRDSLSFDRLSSRDECNLRKIFDRRFSKYLINNDSGINAFIEEEIKLARYYQEFFNNPNKNESDLMYLKMLYDWLYYLDYNLNLFKGLTSNSDLNLFDVVLLSNIKDPSNVLLGTFEGYAPNNKLGWFYFGGNNIESIILDDYHLFVIDNIPHNP